MKKQKIIIFYPSYENGGASIILINLVNFFLKNNINVELLSLNAEYKYFINSKKIKIFNLNKKKKPYLKNSFLSNCYSIKKLFFLLKTNNKDSTVLFSMQRHLISTIFGKIFNYQTIIRNSEDPFGATKYADNKIISFLVFVSKFLSFNLADKIITNANKSFNSIKFFLINKSKVVVIFNPYISKYSKNKIYKTRKEKILLAAGRFSKQKNFEFLIEVFSDITKKIKDYKLVIIGSGSYKSKILRKINYFRLQKKIKLKSWTKDISKELIKSKVFILPSLYEGCPNILVDAISNSIPCISSNCSGAEDVLKNNKAGIIYPINDKNKLKKGIIKIINNYSYYNNSAKKFSKSKIRFDIEKQSLKYMKILFK